MFNFLKKRKPESNNNNTEQVTSGSSVGSEYPDFDPKAAQKAKDEYLEKTNASPHSDRVEDIDKAHAMAIRGDELETTVLEIKKWINEYNEAATHASNSEEHEFYQMRADDMNKRLREFQSNVKSAEELAGAEYDRHKMMQEAIDKLDITLEASGLVPEGKEKEN